MKVHVFFFARLREAFGADDRIVEVEEGTTAEGLKDSLLRESYSSLSGLPILYAINESYAEGSRKLRDRDVLALMPPVAGG